jgi:hypothetical protein
MLITEIDSKLEFRGRSRDAMGEEFEKKEVRYKKLWSTRLGAQMAELPPLQTFSQHYGKFLWGLTFCEPAHLSFCDRGHRNARYTML